MQLTNLIKCNIVYAIRWYIYADKSFEDYVTNITDLSGEFID